MKDISSKKDRETFERNFLLRVGLHSPVEMSIAPSSLMGALRKIINGDGSRGRSTARYCFFFFIPLLFAVTRELFVPTKIRALGPSEMSTRSQHMYRLDCLSCCEAGDRHDLDC